MSLDVIKGDVSLRVKLPTGGSSGIAVWVVSVGRSAVGGTFGPDIAVLGYRQSSLAVESAILWLSRRAMSIRYRSHSFLDALTWYRKGSGDVTALTLTAIQGDGLPSLAMPFGK